MGVEAISMDLSNTSAMSTALLQINYQLLRHLSQKTLMELATIDGINASGKEEIYGCLFGRDSLKTSLFIIDSFAFHQDIELISISKRSLLTLASLQGRELNIESGEQPGKILHEYRKDRHSHLTSPKGSSRGNWDNPWYVYPDKTMRNYDSIDSTPLFLIAAYKYWQVTQDAEFLLKILPNIESALNWVFTYGDLDKDGLLEYEFPRNRQFGGLLVQSWTDSHESIRQPNGEMPPYPIAPVEVQGEGWLALKLWSDFYRQDPNKQDFSRKLGSQADLMKKRFQELFLFEDKGVMFPAQALDGLKNPLKTITGNPLILLWSTYKEEGLRECILDNEYIEGIIERGFQGDSFDPRAGIRTMSNEALTFNPGQDSYHNGSFWTVLNGLCYAGIKEWGYTKQAQILRTAALQPIQSLGRMVELTVLSDTGEHLPFLSPDGQASCMDQAWTAGAVLYMTAE